MDYLKEWDDYLAQQFSFYSDWNKLRKFLFIFEYFYHGVPWILCIGLGYFFGDKDVSSVARILSFGISLFLILFFHKYSIKLINLV